ncbi:MAG: hypothetical protein LiPW15_560 [Parcubacteria group bacterium LiPW_15]|nr:MAG: hypothetical protein LiPW15_560 [Parcubacteria group bacterium LiPW_15]
MGTPKRQPSPISVIAGRDAPYWYDEIDSNTWAQIIQEALEMLGPLKNASGFQEFFGVVSKKMGWVGGGPHPEKMVFGSGLGYDSLCAEVTPVFVDHKGDHKEEWCLFLLKAGGFALLTCSNALTYSETSICRWYPARASFVPVAEPNIAALADKMGTPPIFWAGIFQKICDLSALDRNLKKARAEDSQRAFDEIWGMRARINMPEGPG